MNLNFFYIPVVFYQKVWLLVLVDMLEEDEIIRKPERWHLI
jgi:hypothetical protein